MSAMSVSIYIVGVEHVAYYMGCKGQGGAGGGGALVVSPGAAVSPSVLLYRPVLVPTVGSTPSRGAVVLRWWGTTRAGMVNCRAGGRWERWM